MYYVFHGYYIYKALPVLFSKKPPKTVKYERWTVVIATNKIFGGITKLQYMGGKIANKQNMTIYTALHT